MLCVKNINISYDQNEVIKNGEIIITEGKLYIIHGKSGAGKTSLLNLLALEDNDFSYDYIFNGVNVNDLDNDQINNLKMSHISYINQNPTLIEDLTVSENIEIVCTLENKKYSSHEVSELLKVTDLVKAKDKKVRKLSGGEKQRLAVLCGVLKGAELFLFDEPTSMLDGDNKKIIVSLIDYLVSQNKMVIAVTHELDYFSNYNSYLIDNHEIIKEFEETDQQSEQKLVLKQNKSITKVINKLSVMNFLSKPGLNFIKIFIISLCISMFVGVIQVSSYNLNNQKDSISSLYDNELVVINNPTTAVSQSARFDEEANFAIKDEDVEAIRNLEHVVSAEPFIYFPMFRDYIDLDGENHASIRDTEWILKLEKDGKELKQVNYNELKMNPYAIFPSYQYQNFDERCKTINEDGEIYITKRIAEALGITEPDDCYINLNYMIPLASTPAICSRLDVSYNTDTPVRQMLTAKYNTSFKIRGILEDTTFNTYTTRYESAFFLPLEQILKMQDEAHKEYGDIINNLGNTPIDDPEFTKFFQYELVDKKWNASCYVIYIDNMENTHEVMSQIQEINSDFSINTASFNEGAQIQTSTLSISAIVFPIAIFITLGIASGVIDYLRKKGRRNLEDYLNKNGFNEIRLSELRFKENVLELAASLLITSVLMAIEFKVISLNTPFKINLGIEAILIELMILIALMGVSSLINRILTNKIHDKH